jgi:hypothetical protein
VIVVAPGFSWRRVAIACACLASLGALALIGSLAWQNQQMIAEGVRSLPRPLPADAATQAAIVRGLLEGHRYDGVPPPPPEPGGLPRKKGPRRYPLLLDRTMPITVDRRSASGEPPLPPSPGQPSGDWLSSDDVYLREIPRKLRQELVMGNTESIGQPEPVLPGVRVVERSTALASFAGDGWSGFYAANPEASGLLETSRAVLSADGNQALIYAWNGCGSVCGEGALVLLELRGERWIIRKVLVVANA